MNNISRIPSTSKDARKPINTEIQYVLKNKKRQKREKAAVIQRLQQERKQVQTLVLRSVEAANQQLALFQWYRKRTIIELRALSYLAQYLFSTDIIVPEVVRKAQLEAYLYGGFSWAQLEHLREHYRPIHIRQDQERHNMKYQQKRLFAIFKSWLKTPGQLFSCFRVNTDRFRFGGYYIESAYIFKDWVNEIEFSAGTTRVVYFTFNARRNTWILSSNSDNNNSSSNNSANTRTSGWNMNYSQCLFDYLSKTVVSSDLLLLCRWVPNRDNYNVIGSISNNNIHLRATLLVEPPVLVQLIRHCANCSKFVIEFQLEFRDFISGAEKHWSVPSSSTSNADWVNNNNYSHKYQPCGCLNKRFHLLQQCSSSNNFKNFTIAAQINRYGRVQLGGEYQPWFVRPSIPTNNELDRFGSPSQQAPACMHRQLHQTGCGCFAAMVLEVDITGLIQQDRERLVWMEFVYTTRLGGVFLHTPVVQIVNEYIGLI